MNASHWSGFETVGLAVVTEYESVAAGGPKQVQQDSNSGSLAGAVESEEPEYLALMNFKVEIGNGGEFAVAFGDAAN